MMAFVPILRKFRRQSKKLFVCCLILTVFIITYLTLPSSVQTSTLQVPHHNLLSRQSVQHVYSLQNTSNNNDPRGGMGQEQQDDVLNGNRNLLESGVRSGHPSKLNFNINKHAHRSANPKKRPSDQSISLISRKRENNDSDSEREKIQHFRTHHLITETATLATATILKHITTSSHNIVLQDSEDVQVQSKVNYEQHKKLHSQDDGVESKMNQDQREHSDIEQRVEAEKKRMVKNVKDKILNMDKGSDRHGESVDHKDTATVLGGDRLKSSQRNEHLDNNEAEQQVLDKEHLKIMPKRPIVPEGHTLQVTCAIISLLSQGTSDHAPHMTFELPPLTPSLRDKVLMVARPGMVALRFTTVHRGHEGTYKCKAIDGQDRVTYNTVDIVVMKNDKQLDENGSNKKNELWAQHSMFGDSKHEQNDLSIKARHKKYRKVRVAAEPEPDLEAIRNAIGSKDELVHVNITALLERGKFQEQQVEKFCQRFHLDHIKLQLPFSNQSTFGLYRHLLLNDLTETMFCFMPKVGCTNLRLLFFIVQGFIPLSQLLKERDSVDQNRLEAAQHEQSFMSRNDIQRNYALRHYYKFIMYRNPLERLISGYRSKVQRYPLHGLNENVPHYNFLRKEILLWTNVSEYSKFIRKRGQMYINITFSNFIDYWVRQLDTVRYDEHFRSIFKIAQPCRMRYSFYGNFKHFQTDAQVLVDKIGARPEYIRSGYYEDTESTEKLTPGYYSQLTDKQKRAVLDILAVDLEFYYHVFPEERNVHKSILGIDDELNLPESIKLHYRSNVDIVQEEGL